jgi:formyltetrahydrofolate hydrolase
MAVSVSPLPCRWLWLSAWAKGMVIEVDELARRRGTPLEPRQIQQYVARALCGVPAVSGGRKCRVVVLISGRGSNLQAILDQAGSGALPVDIAAVISNRPGVPGLERARRAGVAALELDHRGFADRPAFEAALIDLIDRQQPDLVILAGFMRVLTAGFTEHYRGRLLNIHPSLLAKASMARAFTSSPPNWMAVR